MDLSRTAGLHGIRDDGDELVIGAMTTHYEVMTSDLVRRHCGLLAEATSTVADPQVRHRGTFGGALSHADPAGDLPGSGARVRHHDGRGGAGRQARGARAGILRQLLQTALEPEEVLVQVRVPKLGADRGWGYRYEKFQRVAQSWAIVAVAALVHRTGGEIGEARIGLVNMGVTPLRATATEEALAGVRAQPAAIEQAAARAADGTSPPTDISGQADYRQHLARVLTQTAVLAAARI